MDDLQFLSQVFKDWAKRKYIDFFIKGDRLTTRTALLLDTLRCHGLLPKELIALKLFGMHGLWLTVDYAHLCSYLEMYEIVPIYSTFAQKFIRDAEVINGDSIIAVRERRLRRNAHNFVVVDNPIRAPYGNNYFEHFDLFPDIGHYLPEGVIILLFLNNIAPLQPGDAQLERREAFYGKEEPSIKKAAEAYRRQMPKHTIIGDLCLPTNVCSARLALAVKRKGIYT